MILTHSTLPFDKTQIGNQINLVRDQLSVFFVDDKDIIFSTETNLKLLKQIVINNNVFLFRTNSVLNI